MHCKWFFIALRCERNNVKNLHHKAEKKSIEIHKALYQESLICRVGKRLRKNICQDLLSKNDSVILLAEVPRTAVSGTNFIVS
ncbi:hypothetical protein DUQ00_12390 [Salmonella bongori]|nr:hypothetical protein [Salmonella bongori]ECC9597102.1 hypothetical protein [Salmonella bongori]